ncbi:type II toxin-antitoxin system TacA family antitoxin, partial [Methylomagnum sp.]
AAYSGMSLSNFLVSTGRDRARQIIAENETVTFSSQDWEAFLARLDAPDEPRPHLEAAAQRYLQRRANIHTDTREL